MRLEGKVAIITGGASGIGREAACLFCQEGAKVVMANLNEATGRQAVAELHRAGYEASYFRVDVTDRRLVREMVEFAVDTYGRLDILVNNAGITQDGFLVKMTEEQWDRVVDTNLKGTFSCAQAVLPQMMAQGSGRIINTSSVVGVYGNIGQTNYVATKAGIIGMTKSWAKELGPRGINVNAVAPGFILTGMTSKVPQKILDMMCEKTPLRRLGTPLDVAKVYLFLASPDADYVNGAIINVDGGLVI